MNTNYVYSVVLLIVMSAWFGHSTIKPFVSSKANENGSKQIISKIVEGFDTQGVKPGEWRTGGKCNIEYINDTPMNSDVHTVAKDKLLNLEGWALDAEKIRLPDRVIARFTDIGNTDFYADSQTGLMRDDVREYLKLPYQVTASGFELVANILDIPVGQYALTLVIQFEDVYYVCDNGRKILVE